MIPCYITTYNLHTWTQATAEECVRLGLHPIIMDMGSTYPPLVEWLADCPHEVLSVGHNGGSNWFWRHGPGKSGQAGALSDFYCVTDPDLDLSGVPDDLVPRMLEAYHANPDVTKIGVSLEVEDVPKSLPDYDAVMVWELPYWRHQREDGTYTANVGHTLALYHPERDMYERFWSAVRLPRPYTARHLPWYLSDEDLRADPELMYYYDHIAHPNPYWSNRTRTRLETTDDDT